MSDAEKKTENVAPKVRVPYRKLRGSKSPKDRRYEDLTIIRRRYVSELLELGYTIEQMYAALQQEAGAYYIINPETHKPYAKVTLEKDVKALAEMSRDQLRIRARLDAVRSLRARGFTSTEIHRALSTYGSNSYMENPMTGKPYGITTIEADLTTIRDENLQITQENADTHRARQLMELQEARRAAYQRGQIAVVVQTLQAEMKLLGTAVPERSELDIVVDDRSAKDRLREKIERLSLTSSVKGDEDESDHRAYCG